MKTFLISGSIVDAEADKETFEDVTPAQVNSFIKGLDAGEGLELDITSYGGSVPAGLAICNLLKKASAEGHRTRARVVGLAASMASAVACACDELAIDANAFMMVHNPWTMTAGDAEALRRDAELLDQYRDALVAVYRTKFQATAEQIKKLLDDETWIMGSQVKDFWLDAEVLPAGEPLKAAAFAKAMPKFMNAPKALKEIIMEKAEEVKAQAVSEDANETVSEVVSEASEAANEASETVQAAEPVVEQPEPALEVEEDDAEQPAEDMVPKAECEKRVQGMQSAMAKQINELRREYDAKIKDFEVQMKAKDEELAKAKAEATSLSERLTKAEGELSETASALKAKTDALDALNAGVNTPNDGLPTMREGLAKCSTPAERSAFLASGRWRRD